MRLLITGALCYRALWLLFGSVVVSDFDVWVNPRGQCGQSPPLLLFLLLLSPFPLRLSACIVRNALITGVPWGETDLVLTLTTTWGSQR